MATTVNLHAAKTHLSKLVDQAAAGEEIVIAKAGRPMVRLVPVVEKSERRGFGRDKGKIKIHRDFDDPLPPEFLKAFSIEP
jgi:prevent-host-death family protein